MRRVFLLLAVSAPLLVFSCRPDRPGSGHDATGPCTPVEPAPFGLPDAPELRPPVSRVVLDAKVPTSVLRREIEKQVPVTLATARRQPVGTPGEVSYQVTRGSIQLALEGTELKVSVPVAAEVEICKPLGPVCLRYGACSPRLLAVAKVPLVLSEDYQVQKSRVTVAVTRGCSIAGFDAAPEIRRQAGRHVADIERRINSSIPDIRPYVQGSFGLLQVPVALSRTQCLRVFPTTLVQSRPRLEGDSIRLRLGASGGVALEDPCAEDTEAGRVGLPPRSLDDSLQEDSRVEIPVHIGFGEVSAAMTRAATSAPTHGVLKVRAKGVLQGGKSRLGLTVSLAGTLCGDATFLADLRYEPSRERVVLENVTPVGAPNDDLTRLTGVLTEIMTVPLPIDVPSAATAVAGVIASLTAEVPKPLRFELQMGKASISRVETQASGVVATMTLAGVARLSLE